MKKWIGFITTVSLICSAAKADEVLPEVAQTQETLAEAPLEDAIPLSPDEQAPKQVGKASTDSSNTARNTAMVKYALAAGAVAIGVTALILVSRHGGHH
jgi:hypothetical protein